MSTLIIKQAGVIKGVPRSRSAHHSQSATNSPLCIKNRQTHLISKRVLSYFKFQKQVTFMDMAFMKINLFVYDEVMESYPTDYLQALSTL